MPVTYTITIDFDDDNNFSDAGDNITPDVLEATWRLGMAQPYDAMAAPTTAQITVRNISRAYSPEYTSTPLRPGKWVRIQSDDGLTVRTHLVGIIRRIEPQAGSQGERLAVLYVEGIEPTLAQNRIRLPPQANVTADVVIGKILDEVQVRRAVLNGAFIVGVSGYNTIGTNVLLGPALDPNLETGQSVFAYVADTWSDGIAADAALHQLADSERGRFFVSRSGQPVFYNRHHTLVDMVPDAIFNNNMEGLDYDYGESVVNCVRVEIIPRSLGAPGTTLWTLDSSQSITPGENGTRRIIARFNDSNKRPIGALAIVSPVAYTDYNANSKADGTGIDKTAQVTVALISADASAATLEFRNNGTGSVFLLAGSQLRGTPIYQGDPLRLERTDMTSVTLYGLRTLALNLPALTSLDEADQLARYELARRKNPRGNVLRLHISSRGLSALVVGLSLFDRIVVQDAQTNHVGSYFIIAEEHHLDLGSARHQVTWLLEPGGSDVYVIIGIHNPDGTRVLAY